MCRAAAYRTSAGLRPAASPDAILLSFDNLGEASELERGTWPATCELGYHRSVLQALPWLLDELESRGLSATFFVEAINCELYPGELREIVARGHELGAHGWRHEDWAGLNPGRERELLEQTARAFAELGLSVSGFRPPGGTLRPGSPELLRDHGFTWCSPAGRTPTVREEMVTIPFDWELVDAYYLMERFEPLRRERGDQSNPKTPGELARHLATLIERTGAVQTLILHPFLMLDEAWRQGVSQLLARLAALAADGNRWVGPGGALAERLRQDDA
jgi:peptidoglycan/xylan/chitin deacetylase (PgdA/CDA1 family)